MAATTTTKGRGSIDINWKEVFSHSPDRSDVHFASSPSTAPSRASAKGKRKEEEEGLWWVEDDELRREFAGMSDGEVLVEIASLRRTPRMLEGFLVKHAKMARRRQLLEPEARRRGLDTESATKDGDYRKWDDRSAGKCVYTFGEEDMQGEYASRRYLSEPSPIHSANKKYSQLGVNTLRSLRQGGQRKPIPVDQMYKIKPSSTALPEHRQRILAVDLEESDDEECGQKENNNSNNFTKRRKAHHQDSSLNFEKVKEVVHLDDEDVQPEELVDCGVPDTLDELKIYFPRDDPEAVELTSSDIKCLDPGVYLSSPVINYYIQYIKKSKVHFEDCRDKFHIFNTYFYSKLQETLSGKVEFSKFRRWWKDVNIFERGYIILPIHGMAHWSLIIICIPAKGSNSGPIILHLDSLGMHPSAEIFGTIERYLEEELCHKKKNPPSDISISETIWEDLPRNIQKEKVEVPRQRNEYDCGIFMLYYIERFVREAPERFTRDNLDMFSRNWFKSEVASDLRTRVRELLLEEFESARLGDPMSEAAASDGSDKEESIKGGEPEEVTPCDSSKTVVEDTDTSNEDVEEVRVSEDVEEVRVSEEAPSSIRRGDDKITDCVLSEAATFLDILKDEEDTMEADCDRSKSEREIGILSSERSESNEEFIHRAPGPDPDTTYCDSSDSDMEIIEAPYQRTNRQNCFIC